MGQKPPCKDLNFQQQKENICRQPNFAPLNAVPPCIPTDTA